MGISTSGDSRITSFLEYRISGNKLILSFDCEVKTATGEPKGFIIAGPDQVFYQACAICFNLNNRFVSCLQHTGDAQKTE